MDVRRLQDPKRPFGQAPTAALSALRTMVPLLATDANPAAESAAATALRFLRTNPAATFYCGLLPDQTPTGASPTVGPSPALADCRVTATGH
jgi:histidine ammonia-lyase